MPEIRQAVGCQIAIVGQIYVRASSNRDDTIRIEIDLIGIFDAVVPCEISIVSKRKYKRLAFVLRPISKLLTPRNVDECAENAILLS